MIMISRRADCDCVCVQVITPRAGEQSLKASFFTGPGTNKAKIQCCSVIHSERYAALLLFTTLHFESDHIMFRNTQIKKEN